MAESQCCAIISAFLDSAKLLQYWKEKMTEMFSTITDHVALLPEPNLMNISHMVECDMAHDTCSTVRSLGTKFADKIKVVACDDLPHDANLPIYQNKCFNHTHNIILGAIENNLVKLQEAQMNKDLEIILSHCHVACRLSELLCKIEKEYNETAYYTKGHGCEFNNWCL